jgi:hypothetical protein
MKHTVTIKHNNEEISKTINLPNKNILFCREMYRAQIIDSKKYKLYRKRKHKNRGNENED